MATSEAISADTAARYRHVLQPLTIAGVTLPNRIARTAHQTRIPMGFVNDELIAYHLARAKGGVGLTIIETASIHSSSPIFLDVSSDAAIEGLQRLGDAVRPHGMKLFQQLWHGGSHTVFLDGTPTWSASSNPAHIAREVAPAVPVAMTKAMIDTLVEGFAKGARRVQQAGLDGLEIHAAHGYLLGQFLSPVTNRRTDNYGGSRENRIRFIEEILTAVRSSVGPRFPLGIRVSSTDFTDNGLDGAETGWILGRLTDANLIDYANLTVGDYRSPNKVIGTVFEERGYQLQQHKNIPGNIAVPRLVTGRFITLDDAERALASGVAEIVSMVRATIAAPNLVRQSLRGTQPRPCISCNTCVSSVVTGPLRCAINASQGFETLFADDVFNKAATPRRVVVAGGGPAGLEVARICARRGHDVILFESQKELGGQLRFAARVPGRQDVGAIVDWLSEDTKNSGVEIKLQMPFSSKMFAGLGHVDVVINAAGPETRAPLYQFAVPTLSVRQERGATIRGYRDVIGTSERGDGRSAVVLDDVGFAEGYGSALALLGQGWTVHMISRFGEVADQMQGTLYNKTIRKLLYETGRFTFLPYTYLQEITARSVVVGSLDGLPAEEIDATLVVPVMFGLPNSSLTDGAAKTVAQSHVIGEALSPHRGLKTAIAEGNRIGRAI